MFTLIALALIACTDLAHGNSLGAPSSACEFTAPSYDINERTKKKIGKSKFQRLFFSIVCRLAPVYP
jgi:hypothetical protein